MENPIYYELPVLWKNEQADKLEELGIDASKLEDDIDFLTIDLSGIAGFNPCDDNLHTMVRTFFGVHFIVDISYDNFKKFFEDKTGVVVHKYEI